jgi:hypothetical protein
VLPEITGTSLDKGVEIDALAKLPVEKQRSLAEAAKNGEKVSAISARSACDSDPSHDRLFDVVGDVVVHAPFAASGPRPASELIVTAWISPARNP